MVSPKDASDSNEKRLILNVDDRPSSMYVRDRILRGIGFTVANATTGKAALELAQRLRPDAILLDIHLPDIDGRELCRQLKADPAFTSIPIVLISSTLAGDANRLDVMHWAGADGFIIEPTDAQVMESTLRRVLTKG
jgi:CheY-like chemotaxis protein